MRTCFFSRCCDWDLLFPIILPNSLWLVHRKLSWGICASCCMKQLAFQCFNTRTFCFLLLDNGCKLVHLHLSLDCKSSSFHSNHARLRVFGRCCLRLLLAHSALLFCTHLFIIIAFQEKLQPVHSPNILCSYSSLELCLDACALGNWCSQLKWEALGNLTVQLPLPHKQHCFSWKNETALIFLASQSSSVVQEEPETDPSCSHWGCSRGLVS